MNPSIRQGAVLVLCEITSFHIGIDINQFINSAELQMLPAGGQPVNNRLSNASCLLGISKWAIPIGDLVACGSEVREVGGSPGWSSQRKKKKKKN